MKISDLINNYGEKYSPYSGDLVNHLPMAQLALYKMTDRDVEKVKNFTETYIKEADINLVKKEYKKVKTMEECLGNRDLYEPCLDLVKAEIEEKGVEEVLKDILNTYPLGISSGLFHAVIRVAYSVEGLRLEEEYEDEVARALAYYVTAYREGDLLKRKILSEDAIGEMKKIINNPHIKELLKEKKTTGQKIKGLYEDEIFMKEGFIIDGSEDNKVQALLNLLIPAYKSTEDIVVLHCITGLHATLVLKEYYDDFPKTLDILTTCILNHLLTVKKLKEESLDTNTIKGKSVDMSWNDIFERASKSKDPHGLKMAYTACELYKFYGMARLKEAALIRIK